MIFILKLEICFAIMTNRLAKTGQMFAIFSEDLNKYIVGYN